MRFWTYFAWAVLFAVVGAILFGCGGGGSHSVPVIGPDGQPTGQSVQQPDGPGVGTGAILGGLAGYMLGRSSGGSGSHYSGGGYGGSPQSSTVVNKTVVNKTIINKQAAPATIAKPSIPRYTKPSAPSYSRPSVPSYSRPSTGGGFRSGRR